MPAYNPYVNPYLNNQYTAPYNTAGLPNYQNYISQQIPQQQNEQMYYVHGIEGANAFQIPPGRTKVTLWDEDNNYFYVKGYDAQGIPRVLAWNDYQPHVVEEKSQQQQEHINLSNYATKDDVKAMFDQLIGELSVGERGRIVKTNELNA